MSFSSDVTEANTAETLVKLMYKASTFEDESVILKAVARFAYNNQWIDLNTFTDIEDLHVLFDNEIDPSVSIAFLLIPDGWRLAGLWQAVKLSDQPWWGCDLSVFEIKDRPETYRMVHGARGAKTPALAICISVFMVHSYIDKNP